MNNNRTSRKGIGVPRSDYDVVTSALRSAGVQFVESTYKAERYAPTFAWFGRRKQLVIAFETTSLHFDVKGNYVGREYMSRDECDYFKPRESLDKWDGR